MTKPRVLIVRPYDTHYPYAGELPLTDSVPRSANTGPEALRSNLDLTGNKGNMAIGEALGRIFAIDRQRSAYLNLPDLLAAGWDADRICTSIRRHFDLVVFGMANALRPSYDFTPLADIVGGLDTPYLVLGLGLQRPLPARKDTLPPATWRFLDTANRKAALLGVRGEETQNWLQALGYANTRLLGCPSLYLYPGNFLAIEPPRLEASTQVITAGHLDQPQPRNRILCNLFRESPGWYVMQSEIEFLLKTSRTSRDFMNDATGRADTNLCQRAFAAGLGMTPPFAGYWMFHNMDAWRVFCAQGAYYLGDRLHGGIVALQAGVPSIILWNDLRVREMTAFCALPNVDIMKVGAARPADLVADLLSTSRLRAFKDTFRERLVHFDDALSQCGLARDMGQFQAENRRFPLPDLLNKVARRLKRTIVTLTKG